MHTSESEAIEQTPVGKWAYFGACSNPGDFQTFSVNIFQIVAKARGDKKKSKGIYRVSGRTDAPEQVYADAQAICEELNRYSPHIETSNAKQIAQDVISKRRAERKAAKR